MRFVLAIVLAFGTAALGGLILGEYQLAGTTGVIAGALFALAVAEVTLTAGGPALPGRLPVAMVAVALAGAAGLAWAGWISTGRDWGRVPKGLWLGVALAVVLGPWWLKSGAKRSGPTAQPAAPDTPA